MGRGFARRAAAVVVATVVFGALGAQAALATEADEPASEAAPAALAVQLPDDLFVQDLATPGADLGSVTVSGCVAGGTPSAFVLSTALVDPDGGRPKVVNVPFAASEEPTLPLSTVGSWFDTETLRSGASIEFTAFCSAPASSASATIESAVFALSVPADITVTSLSEGPTGESASVGICRDVIQVTADYHYEIEPGLDVSVPIALARLAVDADRQATFPLEFLSTWLQQTKPSTAGARIELTADCASPLMQTSSVIPLDGDMTSPPPTPTPPPGKGETPDPGAPAPGAPAPGGGGSAPAAPPPTPTPAPAAALADTGGPAPAAAAIALTAVALFGAGLALRIRSRIRPSR
ncbi:hypothetical protein SCB71_04825 [Herbiconiux sp. KACC 21604]|uniref:hypothetical protein n=1 Tax=unclassified Herbiconiux TaxID=2618217 RepID=UPI001492A199|nr:hypothetical protein [Herbiconiux sp. SALV-R1]QJU52674.1 hypothetical protein HL652_02800 [Herbiconiux sp. SALV-R1]WPO87571.1 hypothetical protein SCB71_04825 [Herbiconiux sp. KACC 21604]